jgi:hypothetical protein
MPHALLDSPAEPFTSMRSPLTSALLRLEGVIRRSREAELRNDDLYRSWQERWDSHRNRLAERLRAIDARLNALDAWPAPVPQLGLYGVPADGAAMAPMGG